MEKKALNISMAMPIFKGYEQPGGYLRKDPACHALWYYYLIARKNSEQLNETIILEGDTSDEEQRYNFRQLMSSIAIAYGVTPERMIKFWTNIDMQATTLGLPLLEKKYRQDSVPEIRTQ